MADFQSIKSNEVQLSIKEATWTVCHVSVMDPNSHGGGVVSRSWQMCFAKLRAVFGLRTYFYRYCYWCLSKEELKGGLKKGKRAFCVSTLSLFIVVVVCGNSSLFVWILNSTDAPAAWFMCGMLCHSCHLCLRLLLTEWQCSNDRTKT